VFGGELVILFLLLGYYGGGFLLLGDCVMMKQLGALVSLSGRGILAGLRNLMS